MLKISNMTVTLKHPGRHVKQLLADERHTDSNRVFEAPAGFRVDDMSHSS